MTPEEINVAIAESLGQEYHKPTAAEIASGSYYQYEPNYHGDLNAIHKAENNLTYELNYAHAKHLAEIIGLDGLGNWDYCAAFTFGNATAPQRCEAFLKTIGKWKENKQ